MESQHMAQDEFFDKLGELFRSRMGSDHGAIYLTQKRRKPYQTPADPPRMRISVTYGQEPQPSTAEDPVPDLDASKPAPLLVRVTNGKSKKRKGEKLKLSTLVHPQEVERFYDRYAELCKAGMTELKPRDRSKKKAKARKKKAVL